MKPDKPAKMMSLQEQCQYIDHSVLKPEFSMEEIRRYIQVGIDFGVKMICVNPRAMEPALEMTAGTGIGVGASVDFPFGTGTTENRVHQVEDFLRDGRIAEVDFVSNYGLARGGDWETYGADIKAVADACHRFGKPVKVILETDALTNDQIAKATDVACIAGVDFVKTSSGFFTGKPDVKGATAEVVKLMIQVANGRAKVKGAGCIRTREHFLELIDLGIDRMGIGYRSTPVVLGVKE